MTPDPTAEELAAALAPHRLELLGGFDAAPGDDLPKGTRTLVMIGPGPGFWPHLTAAPEWQDGRPDPVDRWSRRVIGRVACDLGAKALFPFGRPPWRPFTAWALRTGRIHASPVRLLVHDSAGLWVSFRGALALKSALVLPPAPPPPCDSCAGRPCLAACPPRALTAAGYDLPACHGFLDTGPGQDCMGQGCAVRRACPVSARHARMPDQSAYHMRQFHR
jgi:hypothetical protein